ncbi:MAG: EAL domain-containing protein [Gammaproteobacteria bacterium]|nr:EAL domain-containing protein [Gammaproteobacteria bacterium]
MDDFGSGLSSFGYLMDLDVDDIKIDGRLVRDIDRDPVHRALTESIHPIAGVMGRKTIAEFVESSAVLASLQDIGVHYGQGYHLGRPCEISAVTPEASDLATG